MAWIELNINGLRPHLLQREIDTYLEAADTENVDQLCEIIKQVTLMVRGKVSAHRLDILGPDNTVPDELSIHCYVLIREHFLSSSPLDEGETEYRLNQSRRANKALDGLEDGSFKVQPYKDTTGESGSLAGCYGGAPLLDF